MNTENEDYLKSPPHKKVNLMTAMGRFIDKISYNTIILLTILVITLSSYYFTLSPEQNGLDNQKIGTQILERFLNSLYFSTITFTSLGYGDITPYGYGRPIASFVAFLGVCLIALLIGKIASERQFTLLLLLHTSDCQRRISTFKKDIENRKNHIKEIFLKEHENSDKALTSELILICSETKQLISAIKNYLYFHSNQTYLTEFGNDTALVSLYSEIHKLQKELAKLPHKKYADFNLASKSLSLIKSISNFANVMTKHHYKPRKWYARKKPEQDNTFIICQTIILESQKHLRAVRNKINTSMISEVLRKAPFGPPEEWPCDIHKNIARDLLITNNAASQCLKLLFETKKLPKFCKKEIKVNIFEKLAKDIALPNLPEKQEKIRSEILGRLRSTNKAVKVNQIRHKEVTIDLANALRILYENTKNALTKSKDKNEQEELKNILKGVSRLSFNLLKRSVKNECTSKNKDPLKLTTRINNIRNSTELKALLSITLNHNMKKIKHPAAT